MTTVDKLFMFYCIVDDVMYGMNVKPAYPWSDVKINETLIRKGFRVHNAALRQVIIVIIG